MENGRKRRIVLLEKFREGCYNGEELEAIYFDCTTRTIRRDIKKIKETLAGEGELIRRRAGKLILERNKKL